MNMDDLKTSKYLDETMLGLSSTDYCRKFPRKPISEHELRHSETFEPKPSLKEEMDIISDHVEPAGVVMIMGTGRPL